MELLHPAVWHDHDIDFARWLHPAIWHVALESWQWIHQVAAPCKCDTWLWDHNIEFARWQHPAMWQVALGWHAIKFTQMSAILEFHIWFWFWPITAVDMSFCTSLQNFIHIVPPSTEQMTSCRLSIWQTSAISDFKGPIMGSLKAPYRSYIDTIVVNCLVFGKIAFLHFGVEIKDNVSPPS